MKPISPLLDIVYICGHGRSGSTLVGSVLGLAEGYCYIGEGRDVWSDGLADNHACGCGALFRQCPFWTQVFEAAFGGFDTAETKRAATLLTDMYKPPRTYELFRLAWQHDRPGRDIEEYLWILDKLYRAIALVSGSRTIIDSSKSLRYAALLSRMPGVRMRYVNVIRDPRGIVYSRSRRARFRDGSAKPDADLAEGHRVLRVISKWVGRNWLSRRLIRASGGARVLYEEFVRDQRPLLKAIAGNPQAERVARLLAEGVPETTVQHQIAGNWVRGLKISPKESWRSELPPAVSGLTALLSWPWRTSYKFEAFAGEGRRIRR